ncbi:TPA: type I toxin-antitoxin system Ibs family toxin, partial [Escherichia coli]
MMKLLIIVVLLVISFPA